MPTQQETFDKVAVHLLTQGEKSVAEGTTRCLYRGPNGLRCSAGAVLPDEFYDESLEGMAVHEPEVCPIFKSLGYDIELLVRLQDVHDMSEPHEWKDELADVAYRFGLNTDVLEAFAR